MAGPVVLVNLGCTMGFTLSIPTSCLAQQKLECLDGQKLALLFNLIKSKKIGHIKLGLGKMPKKLAQPNVFFPIAKAKSTGLCCRWDMVARLLDPAGLWCVPQQQGWFLDMVWNSRYLSITLDVGLQEIIELGLPLVPQSHNAGAGF